MRQPVAAPRESLGQMLFGTLRRQLLFGVTGALAAMMAFFVWDMTSRQRDLLFERQVEQARALAQSVATSSSAWLAARDVSGLQEIVEAQRRYPELRFAMVLDTQGRVLAHSDPARIGQYVRELPGAAELRVFSQSASLVDVASPVLLADRLLGWVRLGIDQGGAGAAMSRMMRDGALYVLGASLLGFLLAGLMARRLTRRLDAIQKAIDAVRAGQTGRRAQVDGNDEASRLAREFNAMLDTLGEREAELREHRQHLEQLVERRTRALAAARDEAEAASRAKSEFLASISHELRTPLNAILGFAQLFVLDSRLPVQARDNAGEIERAGRHLLSLVNDLIDLARIETGKLELSVEPTQVGAVIDEGLALMAPLARARGIALIETCGDGRAATVRVDYVRLRQVLINLLSNAIKYNRADGEVRLACRLNDGSVRIEVADTGPGIPADKQARIFNAFDRLGAERGNIEGTGIGLVLTRRIVDAMDGHIGFVSAAGQGSTFWVEFAVIETAPPAAPPRESSAVAVAVVEGAAARRVLLYVEDNPMNLRLMRQIIARRPDLELREAPSAEVGLELVRAEKPALILMDINLPGMDGYQALARLKADPATADIPVAAVSANAMKGDEERGLHAGFVAYFAKPLDIPHFLASLDAHLAVSGIRQAEAEAPPMHKDPL